MKTIRLLMLLMAFSVLYSCCNNKEAVTKEPLKEDLKYLTAEPRHYVCYQTDDSVFIDGKLDEKAWQQAEWTDVFTDIEGALKPKPTQETKVKMLWNKNFLFVAAEVSEEHIWAYLEHQDDIVFRDNDFEIFIDPDNDAKNYFEFETNAKGTVFDLFLPHPYRHSSFALHNFDFKGLRHAISIEGTINNGNDKDKKWIVEVAIPFTSLSFGLDEGKPNVDKPWRINFSRVEWDTKWENGKYVKLKDKDGKPLPEHNWVWSPVGAISMHMPERYGYLKFTNAKIGSAKVEFKLPKTESLKSVLWAVFYREDKYHEKNKKYTANLSDLGNDIYNLYDAKEYKLSITCSELNYEAKLESMDGKTKLYITNEGEIK